MEVKPPEPLQKKFPRHPSAGVVLVLAPKRVLVYVLETTRVLILSNDPKWEPIVTISIAADGESDPLLVLLTTLELLTCKRIIDLENNHNQLYHVKTFIVDKFELTVPASDRKVQFRPYYRCPSTRTDLGHHVWLEGCWQEQPCRQSHFRQSCNRT